MARAFIRRFKGPCRLLVAVSGGGDSLALLIALHRAAAEAPEPGVALFAATVDHGLRSQAQAEARFVAALCAGLGIGHRTLRWTGDKPQSGIQAAARMVRHDLLRAEALRIGAAGVVVAHTRDDQAETVAMRQRRTTDAAERAPGLAGIAPATLFKRDCWILRPFLRLSRLSLRRYLQDVGIRWIDDPSNSDSRFERVRLRLAGAAAAVAGDETAAAQRDRRARAAGAAALLRREAGEPVPGVFVIDPSGDDGGDVRLAALMELVSLVGGVSHAPSSAQQEALATFMARTDSGRHTVARALIARRQGRLFLCREDRDLPETVLPPRTAATWDGRFLITNDDPVRPLHQIPVGRESGNERAEKDPEIPHIVRRAARRAMPRFQFSPSMEAGPHRPLSGADQAAITVERIIPRHDTFLPVFDLILADAVAALAGRQSYPAPPVHLD